MWPSDRKLRRRLTVWYILLPSCPRPGRWRWSVTGPSFLSPAIITITAPTLWHRQMNHRSAFDKIWNNWLIKWPLIIGGRLVLARCNPHPDSSLLKTGNNYGQLPWWISQAGPQNTGNRKYKKWKLNVTSFRLFRELQKVSKTLKVIPLIPCHNFKTSLNY